MYNININSVSVVNLLSSNLEELPWIKVPLCKNDCIVVGITEAQSQL